MMKRTLMTAIAAGAIGIAAHSAVGSTFGGASAAAAREPVTTAPSAERCGTSASPSLLGGKLDPGGYGDVRATTMGGRNLPGGYGDVRATDYGGKIDPGGYGD
jgi:hypothetical protein